VNGRGERCQGAMARVGCGRQPGKEDVREFLLDFEVRIAANAGLSAEEQIGSSHGRAKTGPWF